MQKTKPDPKALTPRHFGVNLRLVFETVRHDLPPLRAAIARILADLATTGREV
jgi:uncharacterized protein with HEPN domain